MTSITITGERLTLALAIMRSFVPESNINVQLDHLFMSATDIALVGFVECKVACTSTDATNLALRFDDFPSTMVGDVTIELDNPVVVHSGRANYKLKRLTGVKPGPSPKIPWTNVFTMTPNDLKFGIQTITDAYDKKDSSAAMKITYGPDGIVFEDKLAELVDVTYKRDEITIRKEEAPKVTVLVATDYLKQIQPIIGRLQECIIGIGQDMPLTISGNAAGIGCGWIISNRLDI
jgi:hypothetical protein